MSTLYIEKFVHYLSMIDLTNQNRLKNLVQELKDEATDTCNKHMEYHCEYCDCKEYERKIDLIKTIIEKLNEWIDREEL